MIKGNHRFFILLFISLLELTGTVLPKLVGQETEKIFKYSSNLGNLKVLSPKSSKHYPETVNENETHTPKAENLKSSDFAPSKEKVKTEKEELITDEELELLLFGSIEEDESENKEVEKKNPETITASKLVSSVSTAFGFGFSDNPMYGPYIRDPSSYIEFETESFLLRQADPQFLSYLYFYGAGKRFLEIEKHKLSGILLLQGEHTYKPENSPGSGGVKLRHTYYDQAFDFSDLGLPFSMQVQSNKSEIIPHFGYQLNSKTKLSAETAFGVDQYDNPSENNSGQKFQVNLASKQSKYTTFLAKIFHHTIRYVERKKKDKDGTNLSFGNLQTKKTGFSGTWKRYSENPWLDTLGAELKYSELSDNAGAYYDYSKISAKLSHEIKKDKWKVNTELNWANYTYDVRSVSNGSLFERESYGIDLQLTRKISSDWETYLKWSYEEDQSNARDYEYYANFWALGVKWEK